jgi:hypothetical protein
LLASTTEKQSAGTGGVAAGDGRRDRSRTGSAVHTDAAADPAIAIITFRRGNRFASVVERFSQPLRGPWRRSNLPSMSESLPDTPAAGKMRFGFVHVHFGPQGALIISVVVAVIIFGGFAIVALCDFSSITYAFGYAPTAMTAALLAGIGAAGFAAWLNRSISRHGNKVTGAIAMDDVVVSGDFQLRTRGEDIVGCRQLRCQPFCPAPADLQLTLIVEGGPFKVYQIMGIRLGAAGLAPADYPPGTCYTARDRISMYGKERRLLIDDGKVQNLFTPVGVDDLFQVVARVAQAATRLSPDRSVKGKLVYRVAPANYAQNAFLFGILGIIATAALHSADRRRAVDDFLKGDLQSPKTGRNLLDILKEYGWEVDVMA